MHYLYRRIQWMGTGRGKTTRNRQKQTTKTTLTEGTVIEMTAFVSGHLYFPSCSVGSATVFFTKRRAINSICFFFFFFLQCWTSQIKLIFHCLFSQICKAAPHCSSWEISVIKFMERFFAVHIQFVLLEVT